MVLLPPYPQAVLLALFFFNPYQLKSNITMSEQINTSLPDYNEKEQAAFSNALSVHYIVLALYAIGTIGGSILVLISLLSNVTNDSILKLSLFAVPPILFTLHFLAASGLKKRQLWGYKLSIALGYFLLILFPFGTVLGVLLLQQLSRFGIPLKQ